MSSQGRLVTELEAAKRRSRRGVRAIAELAGVSHGTISNYLAGKLPAGVQPDAWYDALARGFDVPAPRLRRAHLDDLGLVDVSRKRPTTAQSLEDAVRADPGLLPEAKDHLLNQIALLRRVQAATEEPPVSSPAARVLEDAAEALEMATEDEAPAPVPLRGVAKKPAPRPKRGRR